MTSPDTTVLWRLSGRGREQARAVILPGGPPFTLAFFVNEQMDRVENYDTMEIVVFRADEVRRALEADGWSDTASSEQRTTSSEQRRSNSET